MKYPKANWQLQQTNYPNGLKCPNSKPTDSAKVSTEKSRGSSSKHNQKFQKKKKFYPKKGKAKATQEEYESYDEAEFNNDPSERSEDSDEGTSAKLTKLAVNYSTIISPPPSPPQPEKAGEGRMP